MEVFIFVSVQDLIDLFFGLAELMRASSWALSSWSLSALLIRSTVLPNINLSKPIAFFSLFWFRVEFPHFSLWRLRSSLK